jgi:hypothetical protein
MTVRTAALAAALVAVSTTAACTREVQATDASQIERHYGVTGGYAETIATTDGPLTGTLVPVTLADGRQAHLFIPQTPGARSEAVYLRDDQGLHPVRLSETADRAELIRTSSAIATTRPERQPARKRSWEREVLIIGGSAAAGTAIGAVAAGKKGAAVGAAAGGVGGLIYDLMTRR